MRVLVINDDGFESPGLHALAGAIANVGHDVFVVAPSGECSGTGAAVGRLHRSGPIATRSVDLPGLPGVPAHSVSTFPAAAVYAACLGAYGPPPDVVASGINPGANYGHLVIHSGTVGAALTAARIGIPAVAVSIAFDEHEHWETASTLAVAALDWAAAHTPPPVVVNLNVPNRPLAEVLGVREARLAPYDEIWDVRVEVGELHMEYKGRETHLDVGSDIDVALVNAGYAAVTVLSGVTGLPCDGIADALLAAFPGPRAPA